MTDEQIALARRAVACKGWRWMPGMLAIGVGWLSTARICSVTDGIPDLWEYRGYMRGPCTSHCPKDETLWGESHREPIPDLTDPATLGCLLALVREAWGDPLLNVLYLPTEERWGVERWYDGVRRNGACTSEAESLVAALEAAP